MKPAVFIGSSSERLDIAHDLQTGLERYAEVTVWDQGIFELSATSLASLTKELGRFDFGVFVFAPDDVLRMREQEHRAVRDNVIFELGLFIGELGVERCFIVAPKKSQLHLPSDLLGLTMAMFEADRSDGNIVAALGPACSQIGKAIEKKGPRVLKAAVPEKQTASERKTSSPSTAERVHREPDSPLSITAASILCAVMIPDVNYMADVDILRRCFPRSNIVVLKVTSVVELRNVMLDDKYEIVHLVATIEAGTGTVLINDEALEPGILMKLLQVCGARLVVLASCDSAILAEKISGTCSVIAAASRVEEKNLIEWEEAFYKMLARGTLLSEAYEIAREATAAPVVLLLRKDFRVQAQ